MAAAVRDKDTRQMITGVTFPVQRVNGPGFDVRTFTPDNPKDMDDLEAFMTKEDVEQLTKQGAIAGEWRPAGKPREPMRGSAADREITEANKGTMQKEIAALRQEMAALKAAKGKG